MIHARRALVLIGLALFLAGPAAAEGPEAEAPLPHPDPCALLTEALVRAELKLPAKLAFEERVKTKYSPKNLCSYRWAKPDLDAIQARNSKKAMESVKARVEAMKKGEPFKLELERTHDEVSLSVPAQKLATAEQARGAFASALKILREGMSREVKGRKVTMKGKPQLPVKGVGDEAVWGKDNQQLGVRAGRLILWISVSAGKASQAKQHAINLARAILKSEAGKAAMAELEE